MRTCRSLPCIEIACRTACSGATVEDESELRAKPDSTDPPIGPELLAAAVRVAKTTRGDEWMKTARQVLQREGEIRDEIL